MRHSRRAVMAERYKLYLKKHILNGRYATRNLQIIVCFLMVVVLVVSCIAIGTSKPQTVVADAKVNVKDALFGTSEEVKTVVRVTEEVTTQDNITEGTTAEMTTAEALTEEATAETLAQADESEIVAQESLFTDRCIANVEETLNIRKEASEESDFVGSMNPGAIAIVEGKEGEWTKIKSGDVEGYVLTQYILTGAIAEAYAEQYVTLQAIVSENGVNIRSEKSTDADILVVLDKDARLEVLEENGESTTEDVVTEDVAQDSSTKDTEEDIEWLTVMTEDGQVGYVSSDFVQVDELYEIAVSAEELQRRAEEAARLAAEEAARQEAERQAAAGYNSNSSSTSSNSNNTNTYQGEVTTPVTTTEAGECLGTFTITAYCGCTKCSGGSSRTASGTVPTEGRTIAADTSVLPFGTQVVIGGVVYTVEDCGSGVNGNHIDIFFATHKQAMAFGRKTMKVYKY